jgi:hypothetical protein
MTAPAVSAAPLSAKTAAALFLPTRTHANILIYMGFALGTRFATAVRIEITRGDPP